MSSSLNAFIHALAASRKAVQLYPPAHPAYGEAIDTLVDASSDLLADGPVALNRHEGRLYSGSDVIPDDSPATASIMESLEARRIESIVLEPGFAREDAVGLAEVLNLRPGPDLDVEAGLEERGAQNVRISSVVDEDAEAREERDRRREKDRGDHRRLVSMMRDVTSQAVSGSPMDVAGAAPLVETILGRLLEDESAVIGMATISQGGEDGLLHAIGTLIYSLSLGVALGIPEEGLTILGLSALMHDIGKAAFDRSDPEQARAAELLHPKVGADLLSRVPEDGQTPMLVAYEHHMWVDGSGYPEREKDYIAHPYSRMVAIANRFDHLVKGAGDQGSLSPDRAVMQLLAESGSRLDPLYVKLFVRALGVFPIGCVVRLSDHSVGVVSSKGEDAMEPVVRVVYDSYGLELENPVDADLADDERSIVEVLEPETVRIDVANIL